MAISFGALVTGTACRALAITRGAFGETAGIATCKTPPSGFTEYIVDDQFLGYIVEGENVLERIFIFADSKGSQRVCG